MSIVEARPAAQTAAPSQQSLRALSSLNFFLSGTQTAFGPLAAAYLTAQGWTAKDIGFVITIGGTASLVSQAPGGALVDTVRAKRLLVATGVVAVALSVVIFRLWPSLPFVALAEVLQGITGGVLGPAVVAISLGLVVAISLAPRPVVGTARTEPALRSRRERRGHPDDGPHCIFRVALGNVRSGGTRRSGAFLAELNSRARD